MCFILNSLPARNEQVACSNQVSSSRNPTNLRLKS
nr:MAG TPA: hypothetical protein [Caudoviricetes sp.]